MPFSGGTFTRLYNWVTDRDADVKIRADRMDAEMDGFATGLSNTICRDGQSTVSANIPWNNKKITGLGDATDDTDALNRRTADARFQLLTQSLTAETSIASGDEFPFYDDSAAAPRSATWAALKAQLASDGTVFPSGTKTIFYQSTAPTGWTKDTTAALNNAAIRLVTGTGGATGGTADFTTVFAARTITQANLPNVNFTGATNLAGSHTHDIATRSQSSGGSHSGLAIPPMSDSGSSSGTDAATKSDGNHAHTATVNSGGSGTPLDFAVKYADFIICARD